jgi:hypothetical protein
MTMGETRQAFCVLDLSPIRRRLFYLLGSVSASLLSVWTDGIAVGQIIPYALMTAGKPCAIAAF